jgi:hypothetical protein
MRRAVLVLLLAVAGASARASAVPTLRPERLKPGMKGYGLSVFRGTQPERFEVEILGVLKNTFPKQDMILIRMSGAELERHKIIAGMSGSPVYIDGKLIGAVAYGWSFENEPMAGVTPIHNMLAELKTPAARVAGSRTGATGAGSGSQPLQPAAVLPLAARADAWVAPQPLLTPVSLGGFHPQLLERISERFWRLGMLPVAVGAVAAQPRPRARMVPGGSIGVELIRGDLSAVGVGTVTHVENDKILAFGHPFFRGGPVEAPAVQAEVHAIMSSVARSFKLATGVADVGAMIGDWQSCIVADTKTAARMIPVSVEVHSRDTGHSERYAMEVINNQALSPLLVQIAVLNAIFVTAGSSQDTTARISLTAELNDRTVQLSNTFFNPGGGLVDFWALAPLQEIFSTPFGHTEVKRVHVHVDASLARRTAEIKRAYFNKAELQRGETVPLSVVLKPYNQPETTVTIPIKVPAATDSMRFLAVKVMAGSAAPPDVAPPDSLHDYLEMIQKRHRATDLVALVQSASQGMQYRGKLLKKLPASVLAVLDDDSTTGIMTAADVEQIVVATDWVLSGEAVVRAPIRQE